MKLPDITIKTINRMLKHLGTAYRMPFDGSVFLWPDYVNVCQYVSGASIVTWAKHAFEDQVGFTNAVSLMPDLPKNWGKIEFDTNTYLVYVAREDGVYEIHSGWVNEERD